MAPWHRLHEKCRARFLDFCDTGAAAVTSFLCVHQDRLYSIAMGEGNTVTISSKAQWDEHIKSGKTVGRFTQHSLHECMFSHL